MIGGTWLLLSGLLFSLQLAPGSFPKPLTEAEEQHYLQLARQGDEDAKNILIERNLRLVAHIVKKYYARDGEQEDLISVGTVGLIKAVSTFDDSRGVRLATYAARCVENEVLMFLRAGRKSAQDLSLSDTIESGAEGTELSLMDVISQDDDMLENLGNREALSHLRQKMREVLTSQEYEVLTLRYGLRGEPPLRQRETAEKLHISRSYISRIEKRGLNKLREALS